MSYYYPRSWTDLLGKAGEKNYPREINLVNQVYSHSSQDIRNNGDSQRYYRFRLIGNEDSRLPWIYKEVNGSFGNYFGKGFKAFIPVYVVNNPWSWEFNGSLKFLCFPLESYSLESYFDEFLDFLRKHKFGDKAFSGKDGLDFCVKPRFFPKTNTSKSPPKNFGCMTKEVIEKMVLSTKVYEISALRFFQDNEDLVDILKMVGKGCLEKCTLSEARLRWAIG